MHETIKKFISSSIIHSIINLFLVSYHIIIDVKLFWIDKSGCGPYCFLIYFLSSFSLIPIIFAIVIFRKATKDQLLIIESSSKFLMLFEILFSLISSGFLYLNQKELSKILYTCPFCYLINDIDKIFGNYNEKSIDKIKDTCEKKRCFINEVSNDLNKNYLCNFNFQSEKNYCSLFSKYNDTNSKILTKYINFCEHFVDFYKCQKPNSEYKNKFNKYDYICPDKKDIIINIILFYTFLFVDIIIISTIWLIDIYYLKKIISNIFHSVNNKDNNLKETNNTSKEENNSENCNRNNFQREPTQTIIIGNIENNINNNANNINNENNNKQNIIIINNQNNSMEIKNNNNKTNEIDNNQSKSEIQLINNINNDIFKIFNKNNKSQTKICKTEE